MIKIAGIWERGWTTPIMEVDLWRFMLNEFSVDEFIMTPISGIESKDVVEYPSLREAVRANPTLNVVHVEATGETDIEEFEHPENALYLFGTANLNTHDARDRGHQYVKIPTLSNLAGLWPHQAAAIILYDRYLKNR